MKAENEIFLAVLGIVIGLASICVLLDMLFRL